MTGTRVVCVGNAIVDVLVRVNDAFITDAGLTKGAMRLVDAGGVSWDPPSGRTATLAAMHMARRADVPVAMTLSDALCVDRHRAEFLDVLDGRIGVLFGNEAEAAALTGNADPDAAIAALG